MKKILTMKMQCCASWPLKNTTIKVNETKVENDNLSYDELLYAFEELHEELKKLLKKNNILKKENSSLTYSNKKFCDANEKLKLDIEKS